MKKYAYYYEEVGPRKLLGNTYTVIAHSTKHADIKIQKKKRLRYWYFKRRTDLKPIITTKRIGVYSSDLYEELGGKSPY